MNLKKINNFRQRLTTRLFVNNLNDSTLKTNKLIDPKEIKRILIVRPNHRLGNQLLVTPLLQEAIALFPEAKIDLFLKGNLGSILFKNYPQVNRIISLPRNHFKEIFKYIGCWFSLKKHKYDIVINTVSNSSSGSIATKIVNSKHKVFGTIGEDIINNNKDYFHIAKRPVYDFRDYLKASGLVILNNEVPKISIKLSKEEIESGKKTLNELVGNTKKTICIFTYATDEKKYGKDWWFEFYNSIKKEFSEFNIIEILPFENVSQIDFDAPSFYSKDLREIASVIENTTLFIGADSGIMHLANSTNTSTIGLFSRINLEIYQPFSNKSFGINTNNKSSAEIIEEIKKSL